MALPIKKLARTFFLHLPFSMSKNIEYDQLTKKIMRKHLSNGKSFVDVGCHEGEVMDLAIQFAPRTRHFGFEPLPMLFEKLQEKYAHRSTIRLLNLALAEKEGNVAFNFVISNPAYSGIKQRKYPKQENIEEIQVKTGCLDNVIDSSMSISLIKIDVEGGEYGVLKGAEKIIKRDRPIVIFEFGLGASEYYGNNPDKMWALLADQYKMKINTLKGYVKSSNAISKEEFRNLYQSQKEYYFIAYPYN